jgi:hypothetical protein
LGILADTLGAKPSGWPKSPGSAAWHRAHAPALRTSIVNAAAVSVVLPSRWREPALTQPHERRLDEPEQQPAACHGQRQHECHDLDRCGVNVPPCQLRVDQHEDGLVDQIDRV